MEELEKELELLRYFRDEVYNIVEPHVGGMLGINEKGEFDLLLAVKELIEDY